MPLGIFETNYLDGSIPTSKLLKNKLRLVREAGRQLTVCVVVLEMCVLIAFRELLGLVVL